VCSDAARLKSLSRLLSERTQCGWRRDREREIVKLWLEMAQR
jgi:hypothetical protein